jgi:hypothetical protein
MGDEGGRSGATADDQRVMRAEADDAAAPGSESSAFVAAGGDVLSR